MVTIATVVISGIWQSELQTGMPTPWFYTRKSKAFCVMPRPSLRKPSIYLAGLLDTVALGQYLRESILYGCSWDCVIVCMVCVIAPPRDAYSHLLTMNFTQWLFPQDTSCWQLLPSVH